MTDASARLDHPLAGHPLAGPAHDLAAAFLAARRLKHLDFRMEDEGNGGGSEDGQGGGEGTEGGNETGSGTETPDLAAEVAKWKAMARKHEAASKANADKAKQFDEMTEAQKTELQKAVERAEAAEKAAAEATATALRTEIAAAKGVPLSLLVGSTREELEASADAALAWRGEQKPPTPTSSALQRAENTIPPDDLDARIAEAQKARNFTLAVALKQQRAASATKS